MEDQSQLAQDIMFESVLKAGSMYYLPNNQFGLIAFSEVPRISLLDKRGDFLKPPCITQRSLEHAFVLFWLLDGRLQKYVSYHLQPDIFAFRDLCSIQVGAHLYSLISLLHIYIYTTNNSSTHTSTYMIVLRISFFSMKVWVSKIVL